MSQDGAAVGSVKKSEKGGLGGKSGVSPRGAATACCATGCKSNGDPES